MNDSSRRNLFIGLMSGTSLDGLDAALVSIDENSIKTLDSFSLNFPSNLRQKLTQLCSPGGNELDLAGSAGVEYALAAAECINGLLNHSNLDANKVLAIGCHGQTVRHRPDHTPAFTIQIGDASTLAHHTGITVVSDFRMADIAAGGQGAPLVPAFHKAIFSDKSISRVIVNIGGIANITLIPSEIDSQQHTIIGFDTGPGNTLSDQWIQKHKQKNFDNNGEWARNGELDQSLLSTLLEDTYFQKPAPKSTGREHFNLEWLKHYIDKDNDSINVQRTLIELTAKTISQEILALIENFESNVEIFVCGGGTKNTFLMERLQCLLSSYPVKTTKSIGLDPQLVEASAFAWLARQTLGGLSGNLKEATGASSEKILGGIYPA